MKEKLQEYAFIAEIISAIAIVISLVYVGIQVNDSTRAIRSAASSDANGSMQSWYQEIGSNKQMSDLFIHTMRNTDSLSIEDEFQFLMITHAVFLGFQNSYLLTEEGALDPKITEAITAALVGVKDLPGFDLYWHQRKDYLHQGFVAYVEELRKLDTIDTVNIYRIPESEK